MNIYSDNFILCKSIHLQFIHLFPLSANDFICRKHHPSTIVEKLQKLYFAKTSLIKLTVIVYLLQLGRHVIRSVPLKQYLCNHNAIDAKY